MTHDSERTHLWKSSLAKRKEADDHEVARDRLCGAYLKFRERVSHLVSTIKSKLPRLTEGVLTGATPTTGPVLAVAFALNCRVWTEDKDFFGAGVATGATDRIELFLSGSPTGSMGHQPIELKLATCEICR